MPIENESSGKWYRAGDLTYFNRSRREFLKLTGLTIGGILLPRSLHKTALAATPVQVDQAVAQALCDAGVKVVTHVPASGASTIFKAYSDLSGTHPSYAFNEEVAYTIAYNSALAGRRSATVIKSHGLAKAGNSVIDSLTLGITAGFVAIIIDDPTGRHSDNIFSHEAFLCGTGIPFKKTDSIAIYKDILDCYLWSEELQTPVAIFIDTKIISRSTTFERKCLDSPKKNLSSEGIDHR